MNESMVYLRDAMGDKEELMETIKNGNAELHDAIMDLYRYDSKMGIPLNILDYAAEHIDDFQNDANFVKNVVPLFFKDGMTVEHLAYLNSYYAADNPLLDISDFSLLMEMSLEKEKPIPLSEFKKFVSENDDDIDALSSLVIDYTADNADDCAPAVSVCPADDKKDIDAASSSSNAEDVFASIIKAVCRRDEKSAELALEAQDQINNTVDQIQRASTDLVSCFNRLISDKTADKEEIERLNSVIALLQQTLNKKNILISDLYTQIDGLNEKLREAEKVAQQRDAVFSKISELNILTTGGGNIG